MAINHFSRLPNELIYEVFKYLPYKQVAKIRKVDRTFRSLAANSFKTYHYKLSKADIVRSIISKCTLSYHDIGGLTGVTQLRVQLDTATRNLTKLIDASAEAEAAVNEMYIRKFIGKNFSVFNTVHEFYQICVLDALFTPSVLQKSKLYKIIAED